MCKKKNTLKVLLLSLSLYVLNVHVNGVPTKLNLPVKISKSFKKKKKKKKSLKNKLCMGVFGLSHTYTKSPHV